MKKTREPWRPPIAKYLVERGELYVSEVKNWQTGNAKYPWEALQPGDSFTVPTNDENNRRILQSLRAIISVRKKKNKGSYELRQIVDGIWVRRL